jgi:hypothetical protein
MNTYIRRDNGSISVSPSSATPSVTFTKFKPLKCVIIVLHDGVGRGQYKVE